MKTKKILALGLLPLASLVILGACGNDDNTTTTSESTANSTATSSSESHTTDSSKTDGSKLSYKDDDVEIVVNGVAADATNTENADVQPNVLINYTFTNLSDDAKIPQDEFTSHFMVYQGDGEELAPVVDNVTNTANQENVGNQEAKKGEQVIPLISYELKDDSKQVKIVAIDQDGKEIKSEILTID